jgi:hypothetical protein
VVVDHDPEPHREQGVARGGGGKARWERTGLKASWLSSSPTAPAASSVWSCQLATSASAQQVR